MQPFVNSSSYSTCSLEGGCLLYNKTVNTQDQSRLKKKACGFDMTLTSLLIMRAKTRLPLHAEIMKCSPCDLMNLIFDSCSKQDSALATGSMVLNQSHYNYHTLSQPFWHVRPLLHVCFLPLTEQWWYSME